MEKSSLSKKSNYIFEVSSRGVSSTFNLLLVDSIKIDNVVKGLSYNQANLNITIGGVVSIFTLKEEKAEVFYETLTNAWIRLTDNVYPEADLSELR